MKLITRMGPEGEMMLIGEMIGRMEVTISPVHGPRCAWQVLSCLTYEVLAIKCWEESGKGVGGFISLKIKATYSYLIESN